MEDYQKSYFKWLQSETIDEQTQIELQEIANNESEIKERFAKYLSFGTAGLRGKMRAGTNAMNVYTVAHATQALADTINEATTDTKNVVIAWDSRNNSRLFAEVAAEVLAANDIHVYLFDDLRPTPELSFATRLLKCDAGINITASHNPKEYNGYKAYGRDGAQISPSVASKIASRMGKIDILTDVARISLDEAKEQKLVTVLGDYVDNDYVEAVLAERVDPTLIPSMADKLKIVYTSLHGPGTMLVPRVLSAAGVKELYPVTLQMKPNGNFPTTLKPNPEYHEVFELGIKKADEVGADIVIATDPDADRTGASIRTENGFVTLTGNQIGALLLDYILSAYEANGDMPSEPYAVKSIVSTELATKICDDHGVEMHNVLTGFKYIGEVMENHVKSGHGTFILGFEESYGFLKGLYARDKDAVVASMLICEMVAFHAKNERTLAEALDMLYEKYGYYKEGIHEIYFEGLEGADKMAGIMASLRENPPATLGGEKIVKVGDYLEQKITYLESNSARDTELPPSNVLSFESENENITIIRPSGTEPKIKFYFLCHGDTKAEAEAVSNACKNDMIELTK